MILLKLISKEGYTENVECRNIFVENNTEPSESIKGEIF
jgi:hypothetical protein